jgi:hypothetical protein
MIHQVGIDWLFRFSRPTKAVREGRLQTEFNWTTGVASHDGEK